jgi:two-component system KDP operon response regulator KdpE
VSRVLVVDDDHAMLGALGANLRARGYQVQLAVTGEAALLSAADRSHDAAIVDLGLPGMPGIDVVRGLRAWTSIPIIVLSARHQETEKIAALDAGADDYVTKPFGMGELLARLRAALRRSAPAVESSEVVETEHFRIDLVAKRVTDQHGDDLRLTPTQWHLIEVLVRNPGRLVSQRQLLEEVWGPTFVDQTNYLRVFMGQIRRKMEPDPARPRYFLTEAGMGIRFVPSPAPQSPAVTEPSPSLSPSL